MCSEGWAACGIPKEGCNAKLASDRDNCGRCGAHCIMGYCRETRCVEPEVLASNVLTYGVLLQDGKYLYLNKAGAEQHFWRIELAGGKLEKVPTQSSFVPYVFDGTDYLGCRESQAAKPPGKERWGSCDLVRGSLEGSPQSIVKIEHFALGTIALGDGTLYYGTLAEDPDSDHGAIHALPIGGGEAKLLARTEDPLSIAVSGKTVFFASGGSKDKDQKDAGIFRIESGAPPKLVYKGRARHLVIDGNFL